MVSSRYQDLNQQIDFLKTQIPNENLAVDYSPEEITKYRYSVILIHSEIEHYIEEIAVQIMLNSIKSFKEDKIIDRPLLAVAIKSTTVDHRKKLIDVAITKIVGDYIGKVRKHSHGIKEKEVKFIFESIGASFVEDPLYDIILFPDLLWLADERGKSAHHSHNYVASKGISPSVLRNKVDQLLRIIKGIDMDLQLEFNN